jgi:hypothetical protein
MLYHALNAHLGVFHGVVAGKCQAVFIWVHNKIVDDGLIKFTGAKYGELKMALRSNASFDTLIVLHLLVNHDFNNRWCRVYW